LGSVFLYFHIFYNKSFLFGRSFISLFLSLMKGMIFIFPPISSQQESLQTTDGFWGFHSLCPCPSGYTWMLTINKLLFQTVTYRESPNFCALVDKQVDRGTRIFTLFGINWCDLKSTELPCWLFVLIYSIKDLTFERRIVVTLLIRVH